MFHPALLKLIRLQWRGGFRQFVRSLKTARGLMLFGFMLFILLCGLAPLFFVQEVASGMNRFSSNLDKLQQDFLTLILFGITAYSLIFSTGDATVYFTASEVSFLFPSPFTRRQLLTYMLLKSMLGILVISLIFSCFTFTTLGMVIPRIVGVLSTFLYVQLLTMNVAFLRQVLQSRMQTMIRQALGCAASVALLFAIQQMKQAAPESDFVAYLKAFQQSTAGSYILAPFQVFVKMLRAGDFISFLPYGMIVLGIDGLLLALAYRLDAVSLESALEISEKFSERLKRMQTKGVWHAFGSATSAVTKRRVPQLPSWSGIGPLVRLQLLTTIRASNLLFLAFSGILVFPAVVVYLIAGSKHAQNFAPFAGAGAMAYVSLLLCLTMQNEIERIGFLKTLPLRSLSIVLGELLGFVALFSAIQSVFLLTVAGFFPEQASWMFFAAAMTLPLNFLLFGIDKLIFYVYPTRLVKGAPGDFQNAGKQMIFMTLKMLVLGGAILIVALSTLPGALIFQSPLVAVISAAVVLLIECFAIVPLQIMAFDRFDPSDTVVG